MDPNNDREGSISPTQTTGGAMLNNNLSSELLSKLSPQELKIYKMYGKVPRRTDLLAHKLQERKYFDSGDYALSKAGINQGPGEVPSFNNLPVTNPSGLRESIIRRRLSTSQPSSNIGGNSNNDNDNNSNSNSNSNSNNNSNNNSAGSVISGPNYSSGIISSINSSIPNTTSDISDNV